MSADDGEPRKKRTRTQAPRETRKTSSTSQLPSSSSKRSPKKNSALPSCRDDVKINKDVASTSSAKGAPNVSKNSAPGGKKISKKTNHKKDGNLPSENRSSPAESSVVVPCRTRSNNVVHYLTSTTRDSSQNINSSQVLHGPLIRSWSNLVPYSPVYGSSVYSPFKRRVTALVCHPVYPHLVVVGSKGGELVLYNLKNMPDEKFIEGIGAGGSVVSLKFHPEKPTSVYTAAVAGKVRCQDFCGVRDSILLDTCTWQNWFCSLEVFPEKKILIAGDSVGYLYAVSDNGEKVLYKVRVHKSKVTHAEFCPKSPHVLATSSTDHTVKLWDLRMLSGDQRAYPLHTFPHNRGVNSAYFSPSSSSLLTTDQHNELRVYSSPWWDLEVTIPHPHRQFQHLTPIKASWHPMFDAIVVGRYPDNNFCKTDLKTIDFYDGHSGKELYRHQYEGISGISSLNYFNCTGDVLASGMGYHVVFWHNKGEEKASNTDNDNNDKRKPGGNKQLKHKSKKDSSISKKKLLSSL